jgi:hypothetical protein
LPGRSLFPLCCRRNKAQLQERPVGLNVPVLRRPLPCGRCPAQTAPQGSLRSTQSPLSPDSMAMILPAEDVSPFLDEHETSRVDAIMEARYVVPFAACNRVPAAAQQVVLRHADRQLVGLTGPGHGTFTESAAAGLDGVQPSPAKGQYPDKPGRSGIVVPGFGDIDWPDPFQIGPGVALPKIRLTAFALNVVLAITLQNQLVAAPEGVGRQSYPGHGQKNDHCDTPSGPDSRASISRFWPLRRRVRYSGHWGRLTLAKGQRSALQGDEAASAIPDAGRQSLER